MKCQREAGWCEALRMLCEDYLGVAPILPGDSVIIIRDACVKANLGWNRDNYCPLHLARGFLYNTGTKSALYILVSKEAIFMSKIKEGTKKSSRAYRSRTDKNQQRVNHCSRSMYFCRNNNRIFYWKNNHQQKYCKEIQSVFFI